jgi:hypothetical protein
MGEARRRKALEAHVKAVAREGQGVHSLDIYRPAEALEMIARAASGNLTPPTKLVASMVRLFVAKRGTSQSAPCFCCGGPVDRAATLVALAPHVDQPTKAIGGAICPTYDGTDQELRDHVITAWHAVYPSTRPIEMHPTEGRP